MVYFNHSSLKEKKTLTTLIKTYRKVLKSSNLAYTMSFEQGEIFQNYGSPCTDLCLYWYSIVA